MPDPPTSLVPAVKRVTWDDLDTAIYHYRFREHKSQRGTAVLVKRSLSTVQRREARLLKSIPHAEVEQMRTAEGHRLDELMGQATELAMAAVESGELDLARKCLSDVGKYSRDKAHLLNLPATVETAEPVDTEAIADRFRAYLQGRRDQAEDTKNKEAR